MGGQLDGIFLAGSLPHEFIILIVTFFICLWLINFSLSLLSPPLSLPFSHSHPSLSFPLSIPPYPFTSFPSLFPIPLITAGGSGQRYSSPSGSAAKGIFVQLTAQNLQIFLHYFKFFCLELRGPCTRGPLDFAHSAHPIATPLFVIIIIIIYTLV